MRSWMSPNRRRRTTYGRSGPLALHARSGPGRKKQPDAAAREHAALAAIAGGEEAKKLSSPVFPVADALGVAATFLGGRVAGASGKAADSIDNCKRPSTWRMPYRISSPPTGPYPSAPLWSCFAPGREPAKAEQVFREDLRLAAQWLEPARDLEQALRAQGRLAQADDVQRQFGTRGHGPT